jgi:S-adenosylmethionine decarboxylase
MESLGKHLLVEYYECNQEHLNSPELLEDVMLRATERAGATIIDKTFHSFSPHGVTGVVVIAESHVSIHTWPEYGYAAVDIFTCGETIDPWKIEEDLKRVLEAEVVSSMELKRGIFRTAVGQKLSHKPESAT